MDNSNESVGTAAAVSITEVNGLSRDSSTPLLACTHYERHCAFVTPCCHKLYVCRFCHNENENHELNRHNVTEVECLKCHTRQPIVPNCLKCEISFGRYFCEICRMYDDKDKQQFHCEACGICRVGGRDKYFHCPKCDMCLGKELEGDHPCVERVTHSNCPVCLEDLHTSTMNLKVLPCGHITHLLCWKEMLQKGIYACPLCAHCTTDMTDFWHELDEEIAHTPMPEEYRNIMVWILCKDCHKVSESQFHVIGLKCTKCGSYNTCRAAEPSAASDPHGGAQDPCAAMLTDERVGLEDNDGAPAVPDLEHGAHVEPALDPAAERPHGP
jgi:RING finger/CHY zinc finger protein 1